MYIYMWLEAVLQAKDLESALVFEKKNAAGGMGTFGFLHVTSRNLDAEISYGEPCV